MIEIRVRNGLLEYRWREPNRYEDHRAFPPTDWNWSEWKEVKDENGKRFQVCVIGFTAK